MEKFAWVKNAAAHEFVDCHEQSGSVGGHFGACVGLHCDQLDCVEGSHEGRSSYTCQASYGH